MAALLAQAPLAAGRLAQGYRPALSARRVVREYSQPALRSPTLPERRYSGMAARLGFAVTQAQGLGPWRLSLLAPSAQKPPSPAARECPSPPRAAAPAADRRRIATVPRSAPRWPPAQVAGFLSMPRFAWAANSTFPFHR